MLEPTTEQELKDLGEKLIYRLSIKLPEDNKDFRSTSCICEQTGVHDKRLSTDDLNYQAGQIRAFFDANEMSKLPDGTDTILSKENFLIDLYDSDKNFIMGMIMAYRDWAIKYARIYPEKASQRLAKFIGNPKYSDDEQKMFINQLNDAYQKSNHKADKYKKSDAYASITSFCEAKDITEPSHKTLENWWKTANPELFTRKKYN